MVNREDFHEHQLQPSLPFRTAGERWQHTVRLAVQRKLPKLRWFEFTVGVQSRHEAALPRFTAIQHRVQAETDQNYSPEPTEWLKLADWLPPSWRQPLFWWLPVPSSEGLGTKPEESPSMATPSVQYPQALRRESFQPTGSSTAAPQTTVPTTNLDTSLQPYLQSTVVPSPTLLAGFPPGIERSSHFTLDGRLRSFLQQLLQTPLPPVTVYANQTADAITRRYGADALTYGDRILFRTGKYQPQTPEGLALLGHELTHAAQVTLAPSGPITPDYQGAQEQQALVNEATILQQVQAPITRPPGTRTIPTPLGLSQPSTAVSLPYDLGQLRALTQVPAQMTAAATGGPTVTQPHAPGIGGQPQAALEGRRMPPGDSNSGSTNGQTASAFSEPQLTALEEALYPRFEARMRLGLQEDFERGG